MRRIFFIFCLLMFLTKYSKLFAQSDSISKIAPSLSIGLLSQYIWRGQDYGHQPSLQPALSATWKDFTLGYWGAYRLGGTGNHEFDIYIEKTFGPLSFSIWDYWTLSDSGSNRYFDYNKNTSSHLFEAQILYSGSETIPINLLGSYLFYGADSTNSMYFELQYQHTFGSFQTQAFAGFQAMGQFYAPNAAFVHVGCSVTKSFKIHKNWSLPLSLSLNTNPDTRKAYLVAGLTLINQ